MNPVQLALRVLRVDSRSRTSALLTAAGVAIACALIIFLVTLPQAAAERAERANWQTEGMSEGLKDNVEPTMVASYDYAQGEEITRFDVVPNAEFNGGPAAPGPGEVLLSEDLAKLAKELPPEQLGERFPGRIAGVIDDQYLQYPEQLLVVVGHDSTAFNEIVALSDSSNTVLADSAEDEVLLSVLAGVGVVLLTVPSLVLVASAARLIAARRERRLSALRLAGATPRQVVAMVAAETGIAAVGGTVLGLLLGWPLRYVFRNVPWGGGTWLVSDFTPSTTTVLIVSLGIPLLVVLATVVGLRRVVRSPLGAVMEHARKPPSAWRLLLLVAVAVFFAFGINVAGESGNWYFLLAGLAAVVASASFIGPWITAMIGSLFTKLWRHPPMLMAGRRLRSDPKSAYRAASGVVLAVFTGSMALTLLPGFESMSGVGGSFKNSVPYVDVPAAEADAAKGRAAEFLRSSGSPAKVTASASVMLRAPDGTQYPALVMECEQAAKATRMSITSCAGPPSVHTAQSTPLPSTGLSIETTNSAGDSETVPLGSDVPVRTLGDTPSDIDESVLIDPALAPSVLDKNVTTIAIAATPGDFPEMIRTAMAVAAPGAMMDSRELMINDQRTQLDDLRRVTTIGVATAALLAGCSAAITSASSVVDRRRTFGALIAAGTPVRTLGRGLRAEAALPALVAALGAGIGGVAVGASMLPLFEAEASFTPWVLVPVTVGVIVAVLAASASGPMLRKVSAEPFTEE